MDQEKIPEQDEYAEIRENYTPQPWVERNGFAHWAMALAWVFLIWWAFQLFGLFVGLIGVYAKYDSPSLQEITNILLSDIDLVLLINTLSQLVVIGLATFLIVKLHAVKQERLNFLRLKVSSNVWRVTLLSAVLFIVAQPLILFLGWLNSFVPVPDLFSQMQENMAELISKFLKSENSLFLGLFYIGIVPAVCEEILFRGYFLKSLEKSINIWGAIIISGIIFGFFHVQLSNALPLATLGVFLAYVTYVSDSLIPAMVAHFVNNGGQVIASKFYPEMLDEKITPDMDIPVLLVIASILITAALLYYIHTLKLKDAEA